MGLCHVRLFRLSLFILPILGAPPIIVDDSDPMIQYDGEWYAANATDMLYDGFLERMPMFSTLHVLQVFNGSISYNFTGISISVFATPLRNSNYTVQCSVDGNPVHLDANVKKPKFGQSRPVCQQFGLPDDRTHTISVSVSTAPLDHEPPDIHFSGFSFDYFLIESTPSATPWVDSNLDVYLPLLQPAVGIVSSPNPSLNFGMSLTATDNNPDIANVTRGWEFDPENGFHTATIGSQFNLTFTGTSLWWYGYNSNTTGKKPFSATFSIDGGEPTKLRPAEDQTLSQSLQFRTPILQYATHVLIVDYTSNGTLPLTLQSLLIQKTPPADLAANVTGGSFPSTRTSQSPGETSPPTAKRGHLGGIAGGTAGGVAFFILVACIMCLLMRWTHRRRQAMKTAEPSVAVTPHPFTSRTDSEVTVHIRVPRKVRASQDGIEHPATQVLQPPPLNKWSRHHSTPPPTSERDWTAGSAPAKLGEEESLNSGPPVNPTVTPGDSRHPPVVTNMGNQQSVAQITDTLHPTTRDPFTSTSLSGAEGEHEEEGSVLRMASASDLPPAYTTH